MPVNRPCPSWRSLSNRVNHRGWAVTLPSLMILFTGCDLGGRASSVPMDLSGAKYVGQASCVACHQEQAEGHAGSHHDQAMQLATEKTVLGNFDDAQIEHHGVVSRLFRQGDKFMVHTEGPDGQMADFQVKYVFGKEPLQQYMVEFPADDRTSQAGLPRTQVLRLCWDTSREEWFYLPPPDVPEKLHPDDDLHWTGIAQRWNTMCAECHSTDYQKHFTTPDSRPSDASPNAQSRRGVYHSSFMEINVSCEACHGPGSIHVDLAKQWFPGWNRQRGYGLANLKASAEDQIQACAPCHSRRAVVRGGFRAGDNYYDFYTNELLTEAIYYPDGQILDEDYVHGSFIQSKMYHKGIRCTDCHDPHTARLKQRGNQVCTSCHQHPAAKYDSVAHHFHKPGTEGAQCVNCHMPATTYMAVDARRDHSLRIPRPDISLKINTPNACTGCHLDKEKVSAPQRDRLKLYQDWMLAAREGDEEVQAELDRVNRWCDEACDRWYGPERRRDEHFGLAIAAGRSGAEDARDLLLRLLRRRGAEAPAIARATALQLLITVDSQAAAAEAIRLASDPHPLVRTACMSALVGNPSPTQSVGLLEKALADPVRSVRTAAARNLLEYPRSLWSDTAASAFRKGLTELEEGLEYNNDRGGAHLELGILAEQQQRDQQAIRHYENAIAVEPRVAGPRSNLAALLERNMGGSSQPASEVQSRLEEEIARLRKEELQLLARDAELLPDAAAIRYRYGLALYVDGQKEAAAEHLVAAAELEPRQAAYAQAAALLYEALKQWDEAMFWAQEALDRSGNDPSYVLLLERIRKAAPR